MYLARGLDIFIYVCTQLWRHPCTYVETIPENAIGTVLRDHMMQDQDLCTTYVCHSHQEHDGLCGLVLRSLVRPNRSRKSIQPRAESVVRL